MSQKPEEEVISENPELPLVAFATPFQLVDATFEGADGALQPDEKLTDLYFDHVRSALRVKSHEAISMGATAARVRVYVDFE
jgi:hypothetical protein